MRVSPVLLEAGAPAYHQVLSLLPYDHRTGSAVMHSKLADRHELWAVRYATVAVQTVS